MDYLPLNGEDAARQSCRRSIFSMKFLEPFLWVFAIGLTVVLIFRPAAIPASQATNMDTVVAPSVHAFPTAVNVNGEFPTMTASARVPMSDGCYKLSREECCRHHDGRTDQWGGWACVPSAPGKTFISGNVCEPLLAAVGPVGSCSVASTQAGTGVEDAEEARMKAEQAERATGMDAEEERLLMEALRAKMAEAEDAPLKKEAQTKSEPKQKTAQELMQELKEELKLGAKLKAEQGGRFHGLECTLLTKMNQTCAASAAKPVSMAAAGTCGADCLKVCNAASPGHEEYCSSSCSSYCLETGCSLSTEKLHHKVGGTEDMQDYFGYLQGSATCKAAEESSAAEKSALRPDLKSAPEGCFTLSREECCQYKDGRVDQWGGYGCVPAASGKTFFTGNVCEPALAAVGPVGSCEAPKATPKSKITLASAKAAGK